MNVNLKEAVKFHGHLGPYLVLGLLAGDCALKKLKAKKHFGVDVRVWGATKKPKSCFIDGLQLSTGATYGKGNILKLDGRSIKLCVRDCATDRTFSLTFTKQLIKELDEARTHRDSELLAKRLLREKLPNLFCSVLSA